MPIWGRRVCLWDLKYWAKLKLRHNLDVMHIEKNICENLIGTIMNLEGKTKDTLNARIDLKDLNIKEELQLRKEGDSYVMPRARYTSGCILSIFTRVKVSRWVCFQHLKMHKC